MVSRSNTATRRPRRRGAALFVLMTLVVCVPLDAAEPAPRAAWLAGAALDSAETIRRALSATIASGIDTVVAPATPTPEFGFDAFAELIRQAHDQKLRVIASIDVDRVALPGDLPVSRDHVVYQHPEWLMVPRAIAPEMLALDVRSPAYFGELARWTRANGIDGLYLSPLVPEATAFIAATTASLVRRYAVDGVQLDAARYPGEDFDFGRPALDAFRRQVRGILTPAERARLDEMEQTDPFAYPNEFPDEWRRVRANRLTQLVTAARAAIRSVRPDVHVTALVQGPAEADRQAHLQDWRAWLDAHIVDAVAVRSGAAIITASDATTLASLAPAASDGSR
jgi:uncharacterized lipoprotein YddW (UPF0748 family)